MAGEEVKRTPQGEIGVSVASFIGNEFNGEGEYDAVHQNAWQVGLEYYPLESRELPPSESNDRWEGSIGFGVAWRRFTSDPSDIPNRTSPLDEETGQALLTRGSNPERAREKLAEQGVMTPVEELDYLSGSETHPHEFDNAFFLESIFSGQWNWGRLQTGVGRFTFHTGIAARVGAAFYHQPATTGTAEVSFANEAPQQLCQGASNHPRCQNPSPDRSETLDPVLIDMETAYDSNLSIGAHVAVDVTPIGVNVGRWTLKPWVRAFEAYLRVRAFEAYLPITGDRESQEGHFNGGGINLLYAFGGDKRNEGRRKVRVVPR